MPDHNPRPGIADLALKTDFAARCYYRDPKTIFASTTVRDAPFWYDDDFEINLDTFHDRRNAYFFAVNAAGAMTDCRVIENRNVDISWDGIWQARTRIDGRGWTAEFAIPFKTLSFHPDVTTWGFNVERTVSRINEESRWEAARQDATINTMSRAGDLEGLEGLSQGIGLDIRPGNEIYLVFNHEWQEDAFERFAAVRSDARVKLNYTFRF